MKKTQHKKGGICLIYERMKKEYQKLETKINDLQEKLKNFPEGKLICAANGKGVKWYRSDGHKSIYLSKKEKKLAEQLAYKKYLSLQLKILLQEKRAINYYLKHHDANAYLKEQEFLTSAGFSELLTPQLTPISEQLSKWMNEPYEKSNRYPEGLVNRATAGKYVRSKSEVLIDMFLCKHRIPFRYECLLQLGEVSAYPDFTIRHPKTGEVFYWEHLGRMDDPHYASKAYSKLQLYASNGIIPNINLIITCETKDHPLSTEMIEKIIEYYFVDM